MTEATPSDSAPAGSDAVLHFQLDRLDVRGRVARLDVVIDTILTQHDYPTPISGLLAEATLLTVLIGQTMKLRDRFSIQARGKGPVTLLATDYFAPRAEGDPARIRAYAGYDKTTFAESGLEGIALLGEGVMGVTIDQGEGKQPYQGITPLSGESLADCMELYFAQSEQIATRFAVASAFASEPGKEPGWRAGGIVIQHLPKASPLMSGGVDRPSGTDSLMSADDVAAMGETPDDWATAALKLATVEAHELLGPHVAPDALLRRLFHEDAPRVYDPQPVEFGCTCDEKALHTLLSGYEAEALGDMAENGHIVADCQFCGAHYSFAVEDLVGGERQNP